MEHCFISLWLFIFLTLWQVHIQKGYSKYAAINVLLLRLCFFLNITIKMYNLIFCSVLYSILNTIECGTVCCVAGYFAFLLRKVCNNHLFISLLSNLSSHDLKIFGRRYNNCFRLVITESIISVKHKAN